MNNAQDHRAPNKEMGCFIFAPLCLNLSKHGRTEWMIKWESSERLDVGFSKVCVCVCVYGCVLHQWREMLLTVVNVAQPMMQVFSCFYFVY